VIEDDPLKIIDQLKQLEIPICSVCYSEESEPIHSSDGKQHEEEEVVELLPLPKCVCLSKFVVGPLPHPIEMASMTLMDENKEHSSSYGIIRRIENAKSLCDIFNILHVKELQLQRLNYVLMCRTCVKYMMRVSSDVIELEYRDDNEQNPKFTVDAKCPHCSSKFSQRGLQRLIQQKHRDETFLDAITHTKRVAIVMKKVQEVLSKLNESSSIPPTNPAQLVNCEQSSTSAQSIETPETNSELAPQNHHTLFDDSDSSSAANEDSDYEDEDGIGQPREDKTPQSNWAKKGEVLNELLRRDPKLKQEYDDYKYIQSEMRSSQGRQKLGLEESEEESRQKLKMIEQDRKLAEALEQESNGKQHRYKSERSLTKSNNPTSTTISTPSLHPKANRKDVFKSAKSTRKSNNISEPPNRRHDKRLSPKHAKKQSKNYRVYDFVNMCFLKPSESVMHRQKQKRKRSMSRNEANQGTRSASSFSSFSNQNNQPKISIEREISTPSTQSSPSRTSKQSSNHEYNEIFKQSKKDPRSPTFFYEPLGEKIYRDQSKNEISINNEKSSNIDYNQRFKRLQSNRKFILHDEQSKHIQNYYVDDAIVKRKTDNQSISHSTSSSSTKTMTKNCPKVKAISDRDVSSLVSMGFPRGKAVKCLKKCNGNLTMSVAMLCSGRDV